MNSIPAFFTFVATDEFANPSYFHALIIYEKLDEETLCNFDIRTLLEQKKLATKKKNKPRMQQINMVGGRKFHMNRESIRYDEDDEDLAFGNSFEDSFDPQFVGVITAAKL